MEAWIRPALLDGGTRRVVSYESHGQLTDRGEPCGTRVLPKRRPLDHRLGLRHPGRWTHVTGEGRVPAEAARTTEDAHGRFGQTRAAATASLRDGLAFAPVTTAPELAGRKATSLLSSAAQPHRRRPRQQPPAVGGAGTGSGRPARTRRSGRRPLLVSATRTRRRSPGGTISVPAAIVTPACEG